MIRMRNLLYVLPFLLIFNACHEKSAKLTCIKIETDRNTFNPLIEPGVKGKVSVTGYYSDGSIALLEEGVVLSAKTKVASGDVQVIRLNGNEIIPEEGGIATIDAVFVDNGQTFTGQTDIAVTPFYRDYRQILVLKLFLGMDGERKVVSENDLIFNREGDPGQICTFKQALEVIRKTDNLTRKIPKIVYLVGWQKGGHDHWYPAWNEVNRKLKREEDATALESLKWLIREARQYNTTVSLHINMLDCFKESPLWDEYLKKDILARDENGNLMPVWETVKNHECYHLSYTREWDEGMAQKRIDALIDMLPELKEGQTIHIDAFSAMWEPEKRPLSPWHAKPENGGIDMYKEVETQRKIFKYWREKGFDVTGEGILWAHPPGEGFYGLQPMAWWYPGSIQHQMRIPEMITARGRTTRSGDGDFRFASSMHGEEIYLNDKENLPGFLGMFCRTTLPWFYLSQHDRVAFVDEVLYYSGGIRAGEENGKKVIRRGDYILREDNNLFVEAGWREKEIVAWSDAGYKDKVWQLPDAWSDVRSVDIYKITLEGTEPLATGIPVKDQKLVLDLGPGEGISIVPMGSDIGKPNHATR
jgi:hypothetical protein